MTFLDDCYDHEEERWNPAATLYEQKILNMSLYMEIGHERGTLVHAGSKFTEVPGG